MANIKYVYTGAQALDLTNTDIVLTVYTTIDILYLQSFNFYFSVTLYPAYSRVGRGNLVLRHSVLHF